MGMRTSEEKDIAMTRIKRLCLLCCLSSIWITSADAGWEVPKNPQSRAEIVFIQDGKWTVDLACSLNVALFLEYPGKQQTGPATITVGNGQKSVSVRGGFTRDDKEFTTDPRDPAFVALWGKKPPYPADLDKVLAVLFSGRALVFTAEGATYRLPAIDPRVAAAYKNAC
jgi:hypothetical protein